MASCSSDEAESSTASARREAVMEPTGSSRYRATSWYIEDLENDPSPEVIARLIAGPARPNSRPQPNRAHSSPVTTRALQPPAHLRKQGKQRPSSGLFSFRPFSPPQVVRSPLSEVSPGVALTRRGSLFRRASLSPSVAPFRVLNRPAQSTGTQPFPGESAGSYFPPVQGQPTDRDWRFWRRRRSLAPEEEDNEGRRTSFASGEDAPLEPPRLRAASGLSQRSSSPLVQSVQSDSLELSPIEPPCATTSPISSIRALEMIDEAVNESPPTPGPVQDSLRSLPQELRHFRRRSGSAAEVMVNVPDLSSTAVHRKAASLRDLTKPSWVSEESGTGSDDEHQSLPWFRPVRATGRFPPRGSALPPMPLDLPSSDSSRSLTATFPPLSSSASTSTVDNESSPIDPQECDESYNRPSSDDSDGDGQRKQKERERERERWWALSKRTSRYGVQRIRT